MSEYRTFPPIITKKALGLLLLQLREVERGVNVRSLTQEDGTYCLIRFRFKARFFS